MAECIFCAIIAGDLQAQVVFADENVAAFLDVRPRAPGHTMVVPRAHVAALKDLPPDAVGHLFRGVQTVLRGIEAGLAPDGMTIGINQGAVAGQAVPHLHVHLMPRYKGDGGGSIHGVVENPPTEPLEAIAAKIRDGLQKSGASYTLKG